MRAYPTVKDMPNRKQRKALRGVIFWENRQEGNRIRAERKAKKKEQHNG